MKKSKKILSSIMVAFVLYTANAFATSFFSGYAGGKLNYSANREAEEYDPDVKLQAFFAGQFNISESVWSHLEFSVDTHDILSQKLFHEVPSNFQIDELSLIARSKMQNADNYFSLYMGTYDPIGSDIFLQRYFNMPPIASKITESYLGLAGSVLYPHFGIGIADIVRFYNQPIAFGGYFYVNHEDDKYYVLNGDLRFACAYRYFSCDLAAGLGAPLADKYQNEDVIVAIDKVYWHVGTTILFGNSYTTSLFIQAGINNASFNAGSSSTVLSLQDLYLLFEPRFYVQGSHFNITLFSLPPKTVETLLFVEDSLGVDLNLYSEAVTFANKEFTLGSHLSFSLIGKSLLSFKDMENILSDGYNINLTPYISTNFLSGELHIQGNIRIMDFANEQIAKGLSCDIGFRTRF